MNAAATTAVFSLLQSVSDADGGGNNNEEDNDGEEGEFADKSADDDEYEEAVSPRQCPAKRKEH